MLNASSPTSTVSRRGCCAARRSTETAGVIGALSMRRSSRTGAQGLSIADRFQNGRFEL